MKDKKKWIVIGICWLCLGWYMDHSQNDEMGNRYPRAEIGEKGQAYELTVRVEDGKEEVAYPLYVPPQRPSKAQAMEYLERAKEEIEQTFCADKDTMEHVCHDVHMEKTYVKGLVKAEWMLDSYQYMDVQGKIKEKEIPQEGVFMQAKVQLSCEKQKEMYIFPFWLYPKELSKEEELIKMIDAKIQKQAQAEGGTEIELPEKINGKRLYWEKEGDSYFLKFLIFAGVVGVGLILTEKEKEKKERDKQRQEMLLDYPEIVSKILILSQAGMSLKMVWDKISLSYEWKKSNMKGKERLVYEEILRTNRAMKDGESERMALQKFAERIGLISYQRLCRMLVENKNKGTAGLYAQLAKEAEDAFEQRRRIARKLGEEAGTKLLASMMILLMVVMAIVICPALVSLQIGG